MSLLNAFFASLTQAPGDWLTRTALADWYEENGLDRTAGCLRWMVRQRRRPAINAAGWAFWFDGEHPLPYTEKAAHLPAPLFGALHGKRASYTPGLVCIYDSLRDAEEDLHAAWTEVLEAGVWAPDRTP